MNDWENRLILALRVGQNKGEMKKKILCGEDARRGEECS